MEDKKTIIEL